MLCWIHTTSIFTQHTHTPVSARWPPEAPSNPNYSMIYTLHITKGSKTKRKKRKKEKNTQKKPSLFLSRTQAQHLFPWESFPITLEFNKAKHKCTPDSKNISQLFFRSRMEGKKPDIGYRQQNNLLYKGHVIIALGNRQWLLISQAKGSFAASLTPQKKPMAH